MFEGEEREIPDNYAQGSFKIEVCVDATGLRHTYVQLSSRMLCFPKPVPNPRWTIRLRSLGPCTCPQITSGLGSTAVRTSCASYVANKPHFFPVCIVPLPSVFLPCCTAPPSLQVPFLPGRGAGRPAVSGAHRGAHYFRDPVRVPQHVPHQHRLVSACVRAHACMVDRALCRPFSPCCWRYRLVSVWCFHAAVAVAPLPHLRLAGPTPLPSLASWGTIT